MKKLRRLAISLSLFVNVFGLKAIQDINNRLIQAVSVESLKDALEQGADVNWVNNHGYTALMFAARGHDSQEKVEMLLKAGADVNVADDNGTTALMLAVGKGSQEIVEMLLKVGANVNAVGSNGRTVLMFAVGISSQEIVEILLKAGANVNAVNNGNTALMIAIYRGSQEIIEMLLKAGADIHAVHNGTTALMVAAGSGLKKIVEMLLKAGVDINAVNRDGNTALMLVVIENSQEIAIIENSQEMIEILLKAGVDVNVVNHQGETAISMARNPEIKNMLLRYRALKFIKIDQKIDKEPNPEDYVTEFIVPVEADGQNMNSMFEQNDQEYGEQIEAFTKAQADWLRNKLQEAYEPFRSNDKLEPLLRFFDELSLGFFPQISSMFNSREDFLYVLNLLKAHAQGQLLDKLQKMIDLEAQRAV